LEECKSFGEMFERLAFKYVPRELANLVGERSAGVLLFRIVKEAARNSLGEMLKKEFKIATLKDAMIACYAPFERIGKPFEYEIVSEDPLRVRVKKCPHFEFTRDFPVACAACAAVKAGVIEMLTGEKTMVVTEDGKKMGVKDASIIIKRLKHMPSGDPYCEFEVLKK